MIVKDGDLYLVDCNRETCKASLPYAYADLDSAMHDIKEAGWEVIDDKCYCKKCAKKLSKERMKSNG